ncbi:MAG: hypothetical protein Fues2KO_19040 [Fuerstiella sp.]
MNPETSSLDRSATEASVSYVGTDSAPHRSVLAVLRYGPHEFKLRNGDHLQVGRSHLCSVRILDDLRVSRVHCVLFAQNDRLFVRDLGSSNGTYVNEERVGTSPMEVHTGNVLNIGDSILPLTLPYQRRSEQKPR